MNADATVRRFEADLRRFYQNAPQCSRLSAGGEAALGRRSRTASCSRNLPSLPVGESVGNGIPRGRHAETRRF
jgi:hypothetical protein